jgi:hypothetical protein
MYPLSPEQKLNARVRAVCCWALDVALSVFNQNKRVKMQQHVVKETTSCSKALALQSKAKNALLFTHGRPP